MKLAGFFTRQFEQLGELRSFGGSGLGHGGQLGAHGRPGFRGRLQLHRPCVQRRGPIFTAAFQCPGERLRVFLDLGQVARRLDGFQRDPRRVVVVAVFVVEFADELLVFRRRIIRLEFLLDRARVQERPERQQGNDGADVHR